MKPLPIYTQQFPTIDLNEFPESFAGRNRQAKEFAAWFETLKFQMHVTGNFNRTTTYENGRDKLKLWSSRIERKIFGSRYHKKSPEERMFFVAIPETSGASRNLHYHMLLRMPVAKHALFEEHAPLMWEEFNPAGSLYVQRIKDTEEDRKRVIGYDLKDGWTKNCLENIVISTEFHSTKMSSVITTK